MRALEAIISICVACGAAKAQRVEKWTVALGPILTNTRGGYGNSYSIGGLARADAWLWRRRGLSAGVDARLGMLGSYGSECITLEFSGPTCVDYAHITSLYGIGPTVQYAHALVGKTGWMVRAVAQPIWGRTTTNDFPNENVERSFAAWYTGGAVGLMRGSYRFEFEMGLAESVRQYRPQIWSVQLAYAP